uniref:OTU domain-containing protein n=1 Tax=viral metagenome TaxID=1070528 RepID=A0A6C0H479_9ZZZZ
MITSNIDSKVEYAITNNIDKSDLNHEAFVYNAKIYNKHIKFVLGTPKLEFLSNNIMYFNIYLANNGSVVSKIGIYETKNTDYTSLLDSTGDIDLNMMHEPIIFPFAKPLIINNYELIDKFETMSNTSEFNSASDTSSENTSISDIETDEEEKIEDTDEKPQKFISESFDLMELNSQTKDESDYEISKYEEDPSHKWINKYLRSNKYEILDNEGGGDCFFAVLRDALRSVKIDISVQSIREKLANEVTEEILATYKEFFELFYNNMKTTQTQLKEYKKKHLTLKKMITATADGVDKMKMISDVKSNFEKMSSVSDQSKELEELAKEFEFMKDVETVDDLKKVIMELGGKYWADNWALVTLERLYNVKFIVLSQDHFLNGEKELVLQCSEADKKLQAQGVFKPSYYIITDYIKGIHYKLITYDKNIKRGALTFTELPYKIKELVLEKCMEKGAGLYVLIPDFKTFANQHGVQTSPISKTSGYDSLVSTKTPKSQEYDDSIIIQIYSKSKHEKVGEGSGESIKPELKTVKNVLDLNNKKKYPEWRKKLDNDFLVSNLVIDGNNWSSVKHYMLGSRFKDLVDLYGKFMKNGEVGANNEEALKLYNSSVIKKSVKAVIMNDEDFKKIESGLLEKALYAKFTQNDELREILILTGDALINTFKQTKGASPALELMKVRKLITK